MLETLACSEAYFVPLHGFHKVAGLTEHENCSREYPGEFSEAGRVGRSRFSNLRVDSWVE